jgi:HEAT repeat protein
VRLGARAASPLIEILGDTVQGGRAAETLRRMGAEAVPALVDGLRVPADDDPADSCADILAQMGEPGWSALAAAITDERPVVRAGAAYGLWLAREEATIPVLLDALSDTEVSVRGYAALALGGLGETSVIEPVTALADDPDSEVRVCAAATLARLGDHRAVPLFRAALANDGEPARLATGLIGLYEIDAGVEPLIEALSNESAELREACAVALGKVGDPRALPALDLAAEDPVTGAAAADAARTIRALSEPWPEVLPLDDDWEPR